MKKLTREGATFVIEYDSLVNRTVRRIKPSGIRKFFDIANEMDDVISLSVGEPDFHTPWHIREAGIESLEKGRTSYTPQAAGGNFQLYRAPLPREVRPPGRGAGHRGRQRGHRPVRAHFGGAWGRGVDPRTQLCVLCAHYRDGRRRAGHHRDKAGKRLPPHRPACRSSSRQSRKTASASPPRSWKRKSPTRQSC